MSEANNGDESNIETSQVKPEEVDTKENIETMPEESEQPKLVTRDLVVLNVPYTFTTEDLIQVFAIFGEVNHCEIKFDRDNQSRGFGFVRFNDIAAQRACLSSETIMAGNRRLKVKRPHSDFDEAIEASNNRLFVAKISSNLTDDDLRAYFEHFGTIQDIFRPSNGKGYAFIYFGDKESLYLVFDGGEEHFIKGNRVIVACAESKSRGGDYSHMSQDRRGRGRGNSQYGHPAPYGYTRDPYEGYGASYYSYAPYYGYAVGPAPMPYPSGGRGGGGGGGRSRSPNSRHDPYSDNPYGNGTYY